MMGVVSVWDISSIEDTAKRSVAERAAIRIGSRWLVERQRFETVDDLISIVKEEMGRVQP